MDRNIQRLLNRISLVSATVATVSLFYLFCHSSLSCQPLPHHHKTLTLTLSPFPRSSCESASRNLVSPSKRSSKLRSTAAWSRRVDSFSSLFLLLRRLHLLSNSSRVLCVSAGAGHEVAALQDSGVADVTGVDLVDFPPLVSRSDPHNLPFFDCVFDLGFSTGLSGSLFPARFVAELERTVRRGGVSVLAVERCSSEEEVEGVRVLFRRSSLVGVKNVTLVGSEMTLVIMKNNGIPP